MTPAKSFYVALSLIASFVTPVAALAATDVGPTVAFVRGGRLITPSSSIERPEDRGRRMHTNYKIFIADGHASPANAKPDGSAENPPSLACIYKLVKVANGCNPGKVTAVPKTGSNVIVIVDAFDYPTAKHDLVVFSKQYGLPAITSKNFEVTYQTGTKPQVDDLGLWELEEATDIEYAHAMAPNARIVLAEANSNNLSDLLATESVAAKIAEKAGGGEVSMSFAGNEYDTEESTENIYTGKGVVFFAAAGDQPGPRNPAALSNVVGVGGTTISRDNDGNFVGENVWDQSGGGLAQFVPIPSYQSVISNIVGSQRGIPDVALVGGTPVWIYDSYNWRGFILKWTTTQGTSVAAPAMAGIVNSAASFADSTSDELTTVYAKYTNPRDWTDITAGTCTKRPDNLVGWDECTGVGAPLGKKGK